MVIRRIPIHPGTGKSLPVGGAKSRQESASNVAFGEQRMDESVDARAHFHGAVIPEDMLMTGTIVIQATFKQKDAGVGVVVLDCGATTKLTSAADRNAVLPPSLSSGGQTHTLPGLLDAEFIKTWEFTLSSFAAGQEILLWVERLGANASDTFGGRISLVALELQLPLTPAVDDPELLQIAQCRNDMLREILDTAKALKTILQYWS